MPQLKECKVCTVNCKKSVNNNNILYNIVISTVRHMLINNLFKPKALGSAPSWNSEDYYIVLCQIQRLLRIIEQPTEIN